MISSTSLGVPNSVFVVIGVCVAIYLGACLMMALERARSERARERSQIACDQANLASRERTLAEQGVRFASLKDDSIKGLHLMAVQKAQGFPWLANAYSEYFKLLDLRL